MEPEQSRPPRRRRSGRTDLGVRSNVGYFPGAEDNPRTDDLPRRPAGAEGIERNGYFAAGDHRPSRRRSGTRAPARVPTWLTACLIGAVMLCLALFAAEQLMNAYLKKVEDAKRESYQAIVTSHPLYDNYAGWVEQYALEYNLQPAFVSAIILNESSWKPTAESRIGARGLMQLMEKTADWINDQYLHIPGYTYQLMWDPEMNIRFGCWYLSYLSRLFGGDPVSVTAAYHAGQSTVRNWLANSAVSDDGLTLQADRIPASDTRHYAGKVMRDFAIYDALYYRYYNSGDTAIVDPAAAGGPGQ
ncbi:MAG: lytic transglycosylase domain-containing protein [Clostridia bacterium]|nr:lytic transglycosylase domain-containing protein [Clostridia bacterium]